MALSQLHAGLSNTALLFIAAIGLWALVLRFTTRRLTPAWYGAAVVGEVVIVLQAVIGLVLYLQGLDAALPRPFMHILYGVVAVVTLPAAHGYFGNIKDEGAKAIAMALTCVFLWGILLRATSVAQFLPA